MKKELSNLTFEEVMRNAKEFELQRKMGMTPKMRQQIDRDALDLKLRRQAYEDGKQKGQVQGVLFACGMLLAMKFIFEWLL